ncbi:hypothetical protein ACFXD5_08155 [Streptomyces sp. NPDC059385]|uniref:hypothetical protein n=1 Tax=Streptomyces sp. NPDC059385 TaxID=3346817 RepID=UPI0036A997C1
MNPYAHVSADDPLFGAVRIELDHEAGTLGVSGDGLPTVEIRRAPHTVPESQVPIGTRDPEQLTLLVDGAEETLRLSKGFLTRRSYRVEVVSEARECTYLLVPDSLNTSRLTRDERPLGVFTSSGDGHVSADWEAAGESEHAKDPYDAAVGYGLAAAFGTGAEPMWQITLNAALDLWP